MQNFEIFIKIILVALGIVVPIGLYLVHHTIKQYDERIEKLETLCVDQEKCIVANQTDIEWLKKNGTRKRKS